MEKNYQTLATVMKNDKRWKSSKPNSLSSSQTNKTSLFMAFFSCLAWLYVAGQLWQDAQNRAILTNLLNKYMRQRPEILTMDDKLMRLGCKDSARRIVDAEMDLSLAKSQGYFLRNQLQQNRSGKRLLAVIGVYTSFGSRLTRNVIRSSWMPRGEVLKKLEERGLVIRFVIGRSANRGDSLDRNIDQENRKMKDFFILNGHEEAEEESPKKAMFFFSAALQHWDAEFYVKVDDNINLELDGLTEMLEKRQGQNSTYMGCMKSGDVVDTVGRMWYEPEWWKFGDKKSYFRHAAGSVIVLSNDLVQYININSASLHTYAHEDVSVGAWMMGLETTYIDDNRFCCSSSRPDKVCSVA